MRLAFIADIHGNSAALEAVWHDARRRGAERFFCCGDSVGLGPCPNEVLDFLRTNEIPTVQGNVDYNISRIKKRAERYRRKGKWAKYISYPWTWKVLSPANRRFLTELPLALAAELGTLSKALLVPRDEDGQRSRKVKAFGGRRRRRALVVHGSPDDRDGMIHSGAPAHRAARAIAREGYTMLVCGHTHAPFVERFQFDDMWDETIVANCGSCGWSQTDPPTGSYLFVEAEADRPLQVELCWVTYADEPLWEAYRAAGLPKELAELFLA